MKKSIQKTTLRFIATLQQHNNREWFQQNKSFYDDARLDFTSFLDSMLKEAASFEPIAVNQTGKDLAFRFYRDVRFSANKNPYKDHFGAYLAEGGKKSINPGYYLHICPHDQSFIAAGLWMPPAAPLKAVRQEIDYNLDQFESILKAPDFEKFFGAIGGEKLKTNPKGYTVDNPAIAYLRHKSWMVLHALPDAVVTSDALLDECLKAIKLGQPFIEFLMHPMQEISNPAED